MIKNQPGRNENVCLPGVCNGNSHSDDDGDDGGGNNDDDGRDTSPSRRLHGAPTDTEEYYSTTKPVEFSQDPTCLLFCEQQSKSSPQLCASKSYFGGNGSYSECLHHIC